MLKAPSELALRNGKSSDRIMASTAFGAVRARVLLSSPLSGGAEASMRPAMSLGLSRTT